MPLERSTPTNEITRAIKSVLEEGRTAVLATLIDAPSNVGAKLLLEQDGRLTGTFGDELLDEAVTKQARAFLLSREEARTYRLSEFATEVDPRVEGRVLFERIQTEARLVICGAGHVGASLARLAVFLNFKVTLIDDREEFVRREAFPNERIELKLAQDWSQAVLDAIGNGHGVSVAVVTRGHNEDEQCLQAVMKTTPDYVGLIGSKRRTNIVLERLRQSAVDEEQIGHVHAPIGLDIGAVTPEEVALAIIAEIVAVRRAGSGGFLSTSRRDSRR